MYLDSEEKILSFFCFDAKAIKNSYSKNIKEIKIK